MFIELFHMENDPLGVFELFIFKTFNSKIIWKLKSEMFTELFHMELF